MPVSVDSSTQQHPAYANNNNPKSASDCQTVPEQPFAATPLRRDADLDFEDGQFGHFLNFLERATAARDSGCLSEGLQREMRLWFPFVDERMTLYLNIDLRVGKPEVEETQVAPVRHLIVPRVSVPRPLPRIVMPLHNKSVNPLDSPVVQKNIKTEFVQNKLCVPVFKNMTIAEIKHPFKSTIPVQQKNTCSEVRTDSLYLNDLLKKRDDAALELIRSKNRQMSPDTLNDKLVFGQSAKLRHFWAGSNASYPHSFKKMWVEDEGDEQCFIEATDFAKKMIPTMLTGGINEEWQAEERN